MLTLVIPTYTANEKLERMAYDFATTYKQQGAKIQFIQSMRVAGENEIAQRFWESLPIGPVLTSYSPTLAQIDLVEGRDYLVFVNDGDLEGKVQQLLREPYYRDQLWNNGRRAAFERHTYNHRLDQLLNLLKKRYGFKE